MQELIYVVHIENGVCLDDTLLEKLDENIEDITGCNVVRSSIEDDGVIVENGEWEDEE